MSQRHESAALAHAREQASNLKRLLRANDPAKAEAAAARFRVLREFADLPAAEILDRRASITSRQAQTVIALEAGHTSWAGLRAALTKSQAAGRQINIHKMGWPRDHRIEWPLYTPSHAVRPLLDRVVESRGAQATLRDALTATGDDLPQQFLSEWLDIPEGGVHFTRPAIRLLLDQFRDDLVRIEAVHGPIPLPDLLGMADNIRALSDEDLRKEASIAGPPIWNADMHERSWAVLLADELDLRVRRQLADLLPQRTRVPAGLRNFFEGEILNSARIDEDATLATALGSVQQAPALTVAEWFGPVGLWKLLTEEMLPVISRAVVEFTLVDLMAVFGEEMALESLLRLPSEKQIAAVKENVRQGDFDFSAATRLHKMPASSEPVTGERVLRQLFIDDADNVILGFDRDSHAPEDRIEHVLLSNLRGNRAEVVWIHAALAEREANAVGQNPFMFPEGAVYSLIEEDTELVRLTVELNADIGFMFGVIDRTYDNQVDPRRFAYWVREYPRRVVRTESLWNELNSFLEIDDEKGLYRLVRDPANALLRQAGRSAPSRNVGANDDAVSATATQVCRILGQLSGAPSERIKTDMQLSGDVVGLVRWPEFSRALPVALERAFGQPFDLRLSGAGTKVHEIIAWAAKGPGYQGEPTIG